MKPRFFLQWHITHLCNLRCKHCYQEEYNNHMPKEDFYHALDKFTEFMKDKPWDGQINLTGGEPLLHPDFFEFATEIRKRKLRLAILTNGTLIDKETAAKIKALKPMFVQVSLDGIKESHDVVRGKGNFEKTLVGIDNLKREGVRVLVSFTAQKDNHKDFEKLAKVCRKHNVDKLWWDRVVTYTQEDTKEKALTTVEFKKLVKRAIRLKKLYKFLGFKTEISNQRALQFAGTGECGYICSAGNRLLIFLADGSVMPCRRLPFVIGNIKDSDIQTIISQSDIMQELKNFCAPDECMNCKDFYRCKGGAKCITYAQTGSWKNKDVNCFLG